MKSPPEQFRLTAEMNARVKANPDLVSDSSFGLNGFFVVPFNREILRMVVSDQEGWEHVSVSLRHRCPTWEEMCFAKKLFWGEDETVVQYHPKKSEYVNCHPFCLHLWKQTGVEWAIPPKAMVGPS